MLGIGKGNSSCGEPARSPPRVFVAVVLRANPILRPECFHLLGTERGAAGDQRVTSALRLRKPDLTVYTEHAGHFIHMPSVSVPATHFYRVSGSISITRTSVAFKLLTWDRWPLVK